MLASLDVTRPAAREQLRMLGGQAEVGVLNEVDGQSPAQIAKRALQAAKLQAYDVLILDTAGRLSINEALMAELRDIKKLTKPHEILLVADSMTGQDAVNTAEAFHKAVGITGIALTRLDGDARGGAHCRCAMSPAAQSNWQVLAKNRMRLKILIRHALLAAFWIWAMLLRLLRKAAEAIEVEEAERLAKRMAKGQFDMNDFLAQIRQLQKMGGFGGLMGMLPGIGKLQKQIAAAGIDDGMIKRQEAIILSMTKKERISVGLLNASRRKRIAAGSGTSVQEVNRLVKQYQDMARMMKKLGGKTGAAAMKAMLGGAGMGASGIGNAGAMPDLGALSCGLGKGRWCCLN